MTNGKRQKVKAKDKGFEKREMRNEKNNKVEV